MSTANLNISIVDRRMLRHSEAASYIGFSLKAFKNFCPVQPIELAKGEQRFDKRDLDRWIEAQKEGTDADNRDDILARLG